MRRYRNCLRRTSCFAFTEIFALAKIQRHTRYVIDTYRLIEDNTDLEYSLTSLPLGLELAAKALTLAITSTANQEAPSLEVGCGTQKPVMLPSSEEA